MTSKILPVIYGLEATKNQVVTVDNPDQIKDKIGELLFSEANKHISYLLIGYENTMYLIERDGDTSYFKRELTYHPLSDLLK